MQLFAVEAPGPNADKLHPRITDTAKRLWLIYFGYTVAETILLQIAGMSFLDAVNRNGTLSTGGLVQKMQVSRTGMITLQRNTSLFSLCFWQEPILS